MKLMIRESAENGSEMTIKEFLGAVKKIYADHFPDSQCQAKLAKNLGRAIFIDFYLAKDSSEVSHGYAQNDMFKCGFVIHLDDNVETDSPMPDATLEAMSSVIATKPSNKWLAYDATKVPFRKTTGNAKKLLSTIEKYVQKLANTIHTEYENDNIADNYKAIVKSKIGNIK